MEELLCNKVGIIQKGTLLQESPTRELVQSLNEQTFICELNKDLNDEDFTTHPFTALSVSKQHTLEITIQNPTTLGDIFSFLSSKNLVPLNIQPKNNRLEHIFLKLTTQGTVDS